MKRKSIGYKHEMPVQPAFIIGTYNEDGTPNFAPITWVSKTCEKDEDCLIIISMWGTKMTKQNTLRNRQLSINMVSTDMLGLMDYFGQTSGKKGMKKEIPYAYSKAECVEAPTLDMSPWVCECEVQEIVHTGESDTFFCRIKNVQLDERVEADNWGIDLTLLQPVVYSGSYHSVGQYLGEIGAYYKKL